VGGFDGGCGGGAYRGEACEVKGGRTEVGRGKGRVGIGTALGI